MWKTLGHYLDGFGWAAAITHAGLASVGTAEPFLKASHLPRTRHAHQVSALALSKLQHDAYLERAAGITAEDRTEEDWKQSMVTKSPTFKYWDTTLRIEILGLTSVRAHRERDFPLYVETLKALAPWFFAIDHQNHNRRVPIHISYMREVPQRLASLSEETP